MQEHYDPHSVERDAQAFWASHDSFRSREPLRVTGEITDWPGHPPQAIQSMKDRVARANQLGVEADD